jgi:hypothetical protein
VDGPVAPPVDIKAGRSVLGESESFGELPSCERADVPGEVGSTSQLAPRVADEGLVIRLLEKGSLKAVELEKRELAETG